MLTAEHNEHSNNLRMFLLKMSEDIYEELDEIHGLIAELKGIYVNGFRHRYSEFLPVLEEIYEESSQYSIEFLFYNLNTMYQIIEIEANDNSDLEYVRDSLFKLIDHINLESSRYSDRWANQNKLRSLQDENIKLSEILVEKNKEVQFQLNKVQEISEELEKKEALITKLQYDLDDTHALLVESLGAIEMVSRNTDEAQKKIDKSQVDSVTVLSIFSTVVFTFSGGMAVLENVLSLMDKTSICKPVFYILLTGFIIFNTIFAMVYSVGKVIDKSIYAKCEQQECTCIKEDGTPKCGWIKKIRKRLPYVYYFNFMLLILLILDIVAWWLDSIHYYRFPFA